MLLNKHIVITGGARGIGLTIAENCKQHGAKVTIISRSKEDLDQANQKLSFIKDGTVNSVIADVSNKQSIESALFSAANKSGSIYGLICCAGIYGAIGPFVDSSIDDWEKGIDVNLKGTAYSIYYAYKHLEKSDARIILFSGGGQGPLENFSCYASAKGAIWRLTETLGAELAEKNVFVNSIAPGAVNTKFLDDLIQAGPEKVGQKFFEKSLKQKKDGGTSPQKAADLCLYLLSKKSIGLWGKTLSAVWDPYSDFTDLDVLSKSDIYSYRRVVDYKGNTRSS